MSSFPERLPVKCVLGCLALAAAMTVTPRPVEAAPAYEGIGRTATPAEVKAWDIDVRPDFKGLPRGSGSVAQGGDIWEAKCSSCHGIFGEANSTFSPLVGGTTADDIKTGHVARLNDRAFPARTTLMKVSTVSTLWDYIHRAMPWNAPKSLSADEVYAVTAYLLNLGGIVPDDFVLSNDTMAAAQARMPNRNGITLDHALWPGKGLATAKKPDVQAVACMKDCATEPKVASILPDFARNAHGNLAEQNRFVGADVGADTTRPPGAPRRPAQAASAAPAASKPAVGGDGAAAQALLNKYGCVGCHGVTNKILGPSFVEVAKKYAGRSDAASYLAGKIRSGGSGVWGAIPMPPQTLGEADARAIADWLAAGATH